MDNQEIELLKEIKSVYDSLLRNIDGEYRGICKIGESGFCYEIHANQLLQKVVELQNTFHPSYLNGSEISDLAHTVDKEVAYVEYRYQKALDSKASRKTKQEVCNAIKKANDQIRLDLFGLLKHIDELENSRVL